MKGYKVTALVCWIFVALLLVWMLVTGILGRGLFAPDGPLSGVRDFAWHNGGGVSLSDGLVGDGETSVSEPISHITVDWVSGSVTVHSYAGSEVKWEERSHKTLSDKQKLRYEVKNGRLAIQAYPDRGWSLFGLGGNHPSKDLELWVPESVELENLALNAASATIDAEGFAAKETEINTASGSITLRDVTAKDLEVGTASGSVTLQDVNAKDLEVGTTSGKLELTGCRADELNLNSVSGSVAAQGYFEKVNVENVSGSIRVRSEVMLKDLNVDTVSGSVTIAIPENEGFTLEHTKVSGGLDSDFALSLRDDEYTYGNGGADFAVSSVSGSLHLTRIESEADGGTGRGGNND